VLGDGIIAPLLPVAVSLIGGILLGSHVAVDERLSLTVLALLLLATSLLFRWPRVQTAAICLATLVLGILLATREMQHLQLTQRPPSSFEVRRATVADQQRPTLFNRSRQRMLRKRDQLAERYLRAGLSDDGFSIVAAMTLGDKSVLSRDLKETYSITGASHVLALSGLHLGIIYWLITLLTVGRRWRMVSQVVTILAIWAFAFLTGLSTSIVRSATMLTVYGLMAVGYRQGASVNVLAFTAIVMLVVSPLAVYDVSFQLSFLSVLAILLFHPLFFQLVPLPWLQAHPVVKWLWGMTTLSLAAQIGVAPLIAFYFHHFSVWFLLANFIVIPCAYVILVGGLLLLLTSLPLMAVALAKVASLMNGALAALSALPLSSIDGLHPTGVQTVLVYVIIGCGYVVLSKCIPPLLLHRRLRV